MSQVRPMKPSSETEWQTTEGQGELIVLYAHDVMLFGLKYFYVIPLYIISFSIYKNYSLNNTSK